MYALFISCCMPQRESQPFVVTFLISYMEPIRIAKLIAGRGICSRREAEELIVQGWVRVNGIAVTTPATRVAPNAEVALDPQARHWLDRRVTILLHKPIAVVSGQPEKGYAPAVSLIRPENRFKGDRSPMTFDERHLEGLAPAGRLDIDSHGLLVLTQDGRIARQIIGDDTNIEKEYLVRFEGEVTDDTVRLLNHGLQLDGRPLKPAQVSVQNEQQLKFILREGRKRQIRRMCELVGLRVVRLKRVRIGNIHLGNLPYGKWRYLAPEEHFLNSEDTLTNYS